MTDFVLDENGGADDVSGAVELWLGDRLLVGDAAAEDVGAELRLAVGLAVGLALSAALGAGELPVTGRAAGADARGGVVGEVAAWSSPPAVHAPAPSAITSQPAAHA